MNGCGRQLIEPLADFRFREFIVVRALNYCLRLLCACLLSLQAVHAQTEDRTVLLATTTSVDNSGLLDYLRPALEKETGFVYKVIAVGTGKALKMGQAGDVDVLLVHEKNSELAFLEAGYGARRTPFMFNDFVLVGPKSDPAGVVGKKFISEAIESIAAGHVPFISRGDDSGTHKKELELWRQAGIEPAGDWYREVGQGMGKTLQIADELQAYTFTDRGTWLFNQDKLDLTIVFAGAEILHNQYSVIAVNPDLHPINHDGAMALSNWMMSRKGQALINQYRVNGQRLFHANGGSSGNAEGTKF